MAPPRIVADSDDEDDEDAFSPVRHPSERPEPEPLSPLHQPSSPGPVDQHEDATVSNSHIGSSNRLSDKTDPSFFANIYDEQQDRAIQQSHLIENIVRQSQKASASSDELSPPPAKGKGKNAAKSMSSVTDITSPVVLNRPGNHQSLFSDDTTQLTTPRKSAGGGDMWDVPSSAESSRGKKRLNTYGKRKRSNSGLMAGFVGGEMFAGNEGAVQGPIEQAAADVAADDSRHGDDEFVKPSPLLASSRKKAKVSLYDATAQNPTFYIAQSNLTTMEKLKYQKVSVPANPYAGMTGSAANPKSSSVSTIAYSTPSLYASSGPPLPWERTNTELEQEEPTQPDTTQQHVIDITSSPDVMAFGHDRPKRRKSISGSHHEATPKATADPLPALDETPASHKRNKKPKRVEEEDELGQDESWDSDGIGYPRETYKPRLSRRRSNATSIHEDETAQPEELEEPVDLVDVDPAEEPVEQDLASTAPPPPTALEVPEVIEQENILTKQPKKRGRKKKQPVIIQDEQPPEETAAPEEPDPLFQAPEMEEVVEKPKRKRGRPRKSDQTIAAETAALPVPAEPLEDLADETRNNDAKEASPEQLEEPKLKKKVQKKKQKKNDTDDDILQDGNPAPKEVDANSSTPSRSASSEPTGKKPNETSAAENSNAKLQAKETPKSSASQSKVLYRVGLSKKTRIAPLLKMIRK